MRSSQWIAFVAARYMWRGRKKSPASVLSVLGIAVGVLALTIILAVMNGFQLGFIENILEISSAHMRVHNVPLERQSDAIKALSETPALTSVLPFRELHILARGSLQAPRGALIRGVPADALQRDRTLAARLAIEEGSFDLQPRDTGKTIVIGVEMARHLFLGLGDEVSLLSISGGVFSGLAEEDDSTNRNYTISGLFRSGSYEYDLTWAFINIDDARALDAEEALPVLGIKLKNRWQDQRALDDVKKTLAAIGLTEAEGIAFSSWRDYNRAFFSALRTEKLMMNILVGLIFVVVGLNIFQSQRRIVLERREEIGLLRAVGATDMAVRFVFVLDGFIIGLSGGILGLALALPIALNIQTVFTFLENTINTFMFAIQDLVYRLGWIIDAQEFAVFSGYIFYIKEIPSRIIPHEVALIFLFGFLSALLASWFASAKVSSTLPAEVLRYE